MVRPERRVVPTDAISVRESVGAPGTRLQPHGEIRTGRTARQELLRASESRRATTPGKRCSRLRQTRCRERSPLWSRRRGGRHEGTPETANNLDENMRQLCGPAIIVKPFARKSHTPFERGFMETGRRKTPVLRHNLPMRRLRVFGAGINAAKIVDLIAWQFADNVEVEGFYDDRRPAGAKGPGNLPILGTVAQGLDEVPRHDVDAFVALGTKASAKSCEIFLALRAAGASLPSLIAPSAHISPS